MMFIVDYLLELYYFPSGSLVELLKVLDSPVNTLFMSVFMELFSLSFSTSQWNHYFLLDRLWLL